jgi:hypothetical protein
MVRIAAQRQSDGKDGPDDDAGVEHTPATTKAPARRYPELPSFHGHRPHSRHAAARIDALKRRGVLSEAAHGRLDPYVQHWTPERAELFSAMFDTKGVKGPELQQMLRQAHAELDAERAGERAALGNTQVSAGYDRQQADERPSEKSTAGNQAVEKRIGNLSARQTAQYSRPPDSATLGDILSASLRSENDGRQAAASGNAGRSGDTWSGASGI